MHIKRALRLLVAGTLAALLLLSLIPILMVGDCAHPFGDDFAFSRFVHYAVEDGTSPLAAVAYTVRRYYLGWQGTYAATAVMSLQPGLISEQAYILTPVILLLALFLSTGALTYTVLRRWLKQSLPLWLGVTAGLLLVTVQYQGNVLQAFFWWNGAAFYTFFYTLMLLLATCMLRLRLEPKHPRLLLAAALFLAVMVGGGNYVTGLLSCLLMAGYALACLLWDRRRLWQPAVVGAVLLACFLVNTLAPGNRVRQEMSDSMDPLRAVGASILQALQDSGQWLSLPLIALLIGLIPILWRALEETEFTFPMPALVTVLLFLILACQNAPHFYARSTAGPGRLRNIVYDTYPLLLLLAESYWLGWLRRRVKERPMPQKLGGGLVALAVILAAVGFTLSAPNTATGQCVQALADGSARAYDVHVTGWAEALSDPEVDPVVVTKLPVYPPLLHHFSLENPEDFANVAAANYYRKSSVTVLPAAQESGTADGVTGDQTKLAEVKP